MRENILNVPAIAILSTRISGPYGPFVLALAEGWWFRYAHQVGFAPFPSVMLNIVSILKNYVSRDTFLGFYTKKPKCKNICLAFLDLV